MTSILIVGAGAVGALFGSALARQGAQVSVVCRSDFAVVQRDGYDILSPSLGDHRFRPHAVYREVGDCKTPPDYLILTVKVLAGVDRAALIRPAVGPAPGAGGRIALDEQPGARLYCARRVVCSSRLRRFCMVDAVMFLLRPG